MSNTDGSESEVRAETGGNADRPVRLANEAELDAFLAATNVALVEFYTEGCSMCRSMEPVLGNLARDLDVRVGLVNPRDDPPLVGRFEVRSVPLFVLLVDGEPVARLADGFVPGDDLAAWIDERTN